MGEVFAAVDDVLGREVAIKTLRGRNDALGARLLDERFRHEARAIAQLAHANIVQVFDVDVLASPPYLVMERVAGPSLKTRIEQAGKLADAEVRALGVQMAQALSAAHARGIVHRDVKPANILAAGAGMWKLADFGVAHVPDSSLTLTGQFIGSPAYAAPEALTKGELGMPADVFALGAVLYEAATGRWPRSDATNPGVAALLAPVPPLRSLAPDASAGLAAAIDRALDIAADRRPSAIELARALASDVDPLQQTTPVAPLPAPLPTAAPRAVVIASPALAWQRRLPWIVAGAAVVVAVIAISIATGGDKAPAATPIAPIAPAAMASDQPHAIQIAPPADLDHRSAKEWNKLVRKIEEGRIDDALDKLDDFERKHGASVETAQLRGQLERLPRAERRRGDD
jgi:serine/threonine-protein kinase